MKLLKLFGIFLFITSVNALESNKCNVVNKYPNLCRVNICESNLCNRIKVSGDFLYWKASVSGLPYAVNAFFGTIENVPNFETLLEMVFSSHPGFRIEGEFKFDKGWFLSTSWTRNHAKASHFQEVSSVPGNFLEPIWGIPVGPTKSMSITQLAKYDDFDLLVRKNIFLGTHFLSQTFFGLDYLTLKQRRTLGSFLLLDNTNVFELSKIINNFRGTGLKIGFECNYYPIKWFSLYGKGSYSLLYGKFKLEDLDTIQLDNFIVHDQINDEKGIVNSFNIISGIKGNLFFCCNKIILSFHVSYEFVYLPDQIRINRIISQATVGLPLLGHGNVGFNGLTTGLELNF